MPVANILIEEGGPERLHLGVDIWGNALTPVYSFLWMLKYTFINNNFGDYGTIIWNMS
jgi:hypothetical protein